MVRVTPNSEQEALLRGYMGSGRATYNILLWHVKAALDQRKAEQSYGIIDNDLTSAPLSWGALNQWFKANRDKVMPWWREIPARVMDNAAKYLATALHRFFSGKAKFPVFKRKGKGLNTGLTPVAFKDRSNNWIGVGGREVLLPISQQVRKELGYRKAKELSQVPVTKDNNARRAAKLVHSGRATVQEITYSFSGGYWWASIRLRVTPKSATRATRQPELRIQDSVLGIDAIFGTDFVALSEPIVGITDEYGKIKAPKFLLQALKQLAEAQQWLVRTQPDSNNHHRALKKIQRLHGRVAARREQWHQELAIELTERFELIGIETLNLRGMARRSKDGGYRFGRSVGEQAHGQFKTILTRQADKRNSKVIPVSRFYPSSKTCSKCGTVKTKLPLSERMYKCECGLVLDRDVNAARNIAAKVRELHDSVSDTGRASTGKTPAVSGRVRKTRQKPSGRVLKRNNPESDSPTGLG